MNLTVSTVARSLADYLAPYFPGVTFCEAPTQQGSAPPMMFLQVRYSTVPLETGGFWRRRLGLDLTYLAEYNLPNLQQLYQTAGETLDLVMETFPYSDGETGGTVLLRTREREARIDLDALHYRFELLERVTLPADFVPMETMDYHEEVSNGKET